MTPEFAEKLKRNLDSFRHFVEGKIIGSCRLAHYVGVDRPYTFDVSLIEMEREISFYLADGFLVGWYLDDERLLIWVQEPGCPIPPMEKVIAEEALTDIDALLREAGFGNNA